MVRANENSVGDNSHNQPRWRFGPTATLKRFCANCEGATAVEYGLVVGLVAVASILAFTLLGNGLVNLFGTPDSGASGVFKDAATSPNL